MKLSDIEKVFALRKERDYLRQLSILVGTGHGLKIGAQNIRPDLAEQVFPALKHTFAAEIARVGRDLAALGVTAE